MPTVNGYVTGEPIEATDINQFFLRGSRNVIINGDMSVNQRGTSTGTGAVADAAYGLDRWVFLGDGTTGTINQSVIAPTQNMFSMSCSPVTSNKKFGFVQIIENKNLAGLKNTTVSLQFKMNIAGANITNVKAAVISWAGTADSVTRDVVSSWNASGTTPTLVANWSYVNTPTNLFTVAGSWVTCKLTALPNNPTTNNLAVFIWCDTTAVTSSDVMYLTDVQLEAGSIATPFERRIFSEQVAACQRYYEKSYDLSTAPATSTNVGIVYMNGSSDSVGRQFVPVKFSVTKRSAAYTVTYYRVGGTINLWDGLWNGGTNTSTNGTLYPSTGSFVVNVTPAGMPAYVVTASYGHWVVENEL